MADLIALREASQLALDVVVRMDKAVCERDEIVVKALASHAVVETAYALQIVGRLICLASGRTP